MQPQRLAFQSLWDGIGIQLRKPSGVWGRVAGGLMRLANAKSNALAVAALGLRPGETLLELGCGPGHALRAVLRSPQFAWVIGLDWSDVMLTRSARRNRTELEAGRLVLIRGNFDWLPFADETSDAILAVNVAYFMSTPAALRETHRVLRRGGRIVLYATHRSSMQNWRFAGGDTHRLFDHEALRTLFVNAGFDQQDIRIDEVDAGFGVAGLLVVAHKACA